MARLDRSSLIVQGVRDPDLAGGNSGIVRKLLAVDRNAVDGDHNGCDHRRTNRAQALDKAAFRILATIIGIAASIVIIGLFSQSRDLLLIAYAGWMGLCAYAAGLLDGNRAYAAVLSGFTMALIAIQEIDIRGVCSKRA